jgi:23S rRNA maturation-related 3'-5' exoribonuclease YhaM
MDLPVPLYAFVIEEELRRAKNNSLFWRVKIKTVVGSISGFMWGADTDAHESMKYPHIGDIIELTDFKDQMEERGSIIINAFTRLPESEIPENAKVILELEKMSEEDIKWAKRIINDKSCWDDKKRYDFTQLCIDGFGRDEFYSCPAATHVHHQYQGGLLVHTAEVVELADAMVTVSMRRYPFITRDVVRSACILHDIGKIRTYYFNKVGVAQKLRTEQSIGHIYFGMRGVENIGEEVGIDRDFLTEVLHCIATHHGSPQFGSLKEVQTIEAGIVSKIDYISSRNGMLAKVFNETIEADQPTPENYKVYGDEYFTTIGIKKYLEDA